jgi:DNA-binding response OmpR family regulator
MKKILVADDDPGVRELCSVVLTNEGYQVVAAEDAATCIHLTRKEQPDLVLLDWMMPGVDGMDALRCLKRDGVTKHIPVVMLTALDGVPEIMVATFCGADSYVTKPFEVDDLLSLIGRFVQNAEADRTPETSAV